MTLPFINSEQKFAFQQGVGAFITSQLVPAIIVPSLQIRLHSGDTVSTQQFKNAKSMVQIHLSSDFPVQVIAVHLGRLPYCSMTCHK